MYKSIQIKDFYEENWKATGGKPFIIKHYNSETEYIIYCLSRTIYAVEGSNGINEVRWFDTGSNWVLVDCFRQGIDCKCDRWTLNILQNKQCPHE